jgi:hypothetical protein
LAVEATFRDITYSYYNEGDEMGASWSLEEEENISVPYTGYTVDTGDPEGYQPMGRR